MKLTRWDNGETIHESKHVTIKECVEDAIKQGVSLYRINLRGADMRCADMRGADMTGADMRGADMRYADMRYANLRHADLRSANMRGANMRHADLRSANMRGANMRGADMTGADMTGADMTGTDLDFSSWPLWCGSCEVNLDKKNNERFAYYCMVNMSAEVLADFLQNPVEFANRFAVRKGFIKIKAGEE